MSPIGLNGKAALVTGGSRGIGGRLREGSRPTAPASRLLT